jgi:hypothetical protein
MWIWALYNSNHPVEEKGRKENMVEGKARAKSSTKCFWLEKVFKILKIVSVQRALLLLYNEQIAHGSAFEDCPYRESDLQMGQTETPKSMPRDHPSGKRKERTESVTPSPAKNQTAMVWHWDNKS